MAKYILQYVDFLTLNKFLDCRRIDRGITTINHDLLTMSVPTGSRRKVDHGASHFLATFKIFNKLQIGKSKTYVPALLAGTGINPLPTLSTSSVVISTIVISDW